MKENKRNSYINFTREGSGQGIKYYINPDFILQIKFFSHLALVFGFGALVINSSFNDFQNNFLR